MIQQQEIILPSMSRGCHLVTGVIMQKLEQLPQSGLLNLFLQHTSAGITINENADPSVRQDLNEALDHISPENEPYYTHTYEGPDDMPAHIKSSLLGVSVTVPICNGQLALGTWQGIYMCEFRDHGGRRKVLATIYS